MKNWDYYTHPVGLSHSTYIDIRAYNKELIDNINNTPLVAAERDKQLSQVDKIVREHFRELDRPYMAAKAALEQEFWKDAREELGYANFLNDAGISAIEYYAYERGHSHGFSSTYEELVEVVALVEKLVGNLKTPAMIGVKNDVES